MTMTFYDLYEKLPAPYESVLTKAFKHGRVTVARNMSQAIADGDPVLWVPAKVMSRVEELTVEENARVLAARAPLQALLAP